MIKITLTILPV